MNIDDIPAPKSLFDPVPLEDGGHFTPFQSLIEGSLLGLSQMVSKCGIAKPASEVIYSQFWESGSQARNDDMVRQALYMTLATLFLRSEGVPVIRYYEGDEHPDFVDAARLRSEWQEFKTLIETLHPELA